MPGSPLRLGPFIGGLNTGSDPTAIADAELAECINFELDIDGSLISRPPFKEIAGSASFTERILFLCEATFSGITYLIGSNVDGVFHYRADTNAWTLITSSFQAAAAVQYADMVYLVSKPGSGDGGKWDPGSGFTAVAAIPKGQAAVIHKERLFVVPGVNSTVNSSRLIFSDTGNLDSWPGTNFIDIGQGDGTKLIDITVFQNNLLLFKNQATYSLAYDTSPSEASLIRISNTIGVDKQFNMVNYENQIYIFHNGWVYELVGYDFNRLNTKVPFLRDNTVPSAFSEENVFLTTLEDRLICRYYRNIYVFGLRTRTWSEWESVENNLHYFGPILTIHPDTGNRYFSGSCVTANESIIEFVDKHTVSNKEQTILDSTVLITCSAKTKNFDMAISHQYKRLWWWGADVTTANDVVGIATPIVLVFSVTWESLQNIPWNQLQTWAQPTTAPTSVETTASTGTGTSRRFAKFLKGLRYRQINFKVQLTTEGSTVDGPARIFTMMALTESKQVVTKSVN